MYWGCTETVLRLYWGCTENVLGLYWDCTETVLRLCWDCTETYWDCSETVLRLYWACTKAVLRLYWGCTETVLRLFWDSTETLLIFYCTLCTIYITTKLPSCQNWISRIIRRHEINSAKGWRHQGSQWQLCLGLREIKCSQAYYDRAQRPPWAMSNFRELVGSFWQSPTYDWATQIIIIKFEKRNSAFALFCYCSLLLLKNWPQYSDYYAMLSCTTH